MDVQAVMAAWPQATPAQRLGWAQQIRFDITLNEADVPALVDLYRTVLRTGGEAQRFMEEALLTAFARIGASAALPLLRDVLLGRVLGGQTPLAEVVEVVVDITARSGAEEGFQLLERCLEHTDVDVRDLATTGVVRAYREAGRDVPERVCRRLFTMLQSDPIRRVRFSAGLALHDAGRMDLTAVIFWAEDMAGWEEDPTWDLNDEDLVDLFPVPTSQDNEGDATGTAAQP